MARRKNKVSDRIDPLYKDLLDEATGRWKFASEMWEDQRERMLDDLRFCDPETQWPEAVRRQREDDGRPCLTIDRINPFVRQVVNQYRQSRPMPQVNPVGSGSDQDTAEIMQGMVRHIMDRSNGDSAIDTAFEAMVRCGMGWVRILTEYSTPTSFDQEIKIERIANPFQVYPDPTFVQPDGSDMNYVFIACDYSREDFLAEYPESKMSNYSLSDWEGLGNDMPEWVLSKGHGCRVMEYFKRVDKRTTVCLLEDGTIAEKKDLPEGTPVIEERETYLPTIVWYKLTATEILDQREWPGRMIPVVPFLGEELRFNGKCYYTGLVHSAKDAQMAYNYWKSAQTEAIALAPTAPWIVADGSIPQGWTNAWANANKKNYAYLAYKHMTVDGQPVPPPQRNFGEPPIQAINQALVGSLDDLKGTTGMYDANLGNRESSQSGVAIKQLQSQGQISNYHFADNAARSIKQLGRIIIDLIPKIYDSQRVVRIIRPDDMADQVTINGPSGKIGSKGVEAVYRPGVGEYEVTVSVGPSYQTRRQENNALMTELMRGPLGQVISTAAPDLAVGMMDFPIIKELAKRLKRTIPPQFQDHEDQQGPDPQQMQQQMQAMAQQHEQLTQALNAAQQELESRQGEKQMQIEADLRRTQLQEESRIEIERMRLEVEREGLMIKLAELEQKMSMEQAKLDAQRQMKAIDAELSARDTQASTASEQE